MNRLFWFSLFREPLSKKTVLILLFGRLTSLKLLKYYSPSQPFKFRFEFRSKEMKGGPLFLNFLEILHEKRSAFHFLILEFQSKNERPKWPIITRLFRKQKIASFLKNKSSLSIYSKFAFLFFILTKRNFLSTTILL